MKKRNLILLASSALLLASCTTIMSWFGYDPELAKKIQEDGHRAAHEAADLMETLSSVAKYGAAYLGGMVTMPGTKLM